MVRRAPNNELLGGLVHNLIDLMAESMGDATLWRVDLILTSIRGGLEKRLATIDKIDQAKLSNKLTSSIDQLHYILLRHKLDLHECYLGEIKQLQDDADLCLPEQGGDLFDLLPYRGSLSGTKLADLSHLFRTLRMNFTDTVHPIFDRNEHPDREDELQVFDTHAERLRRDVEKALREEQPFLALLCRTLRKSPFREAAAMQVPAMISRTFLESRRTHDGTRILEELSVAGELDRISFSGLLNLFDDVSTLKFLDKSLLEDQARMILSNRW